MADQRFNVTMTQQCGPGRTVLVEAKNPPEARRFAEARYPGFTAHGCNTAR